LQESDLQLLTGYRHAEIGVTQGETREDLSSNVAFEDGEDRVIGDEPGNTGKDQNLSEEALSQV